MSDITFKDKVVVITGAGGGLGKVYALDFASRGAKVVVNDLGGTLSGDSNSTAAADVVVEEIKSKGGIAVANYDNVVTNPAGIIKTAVDAFGTVHVLINNAGILKDSSFKNMTEKQFTDVIDVHLNGAYKLTQCAWKYFKEQGYGRILNTASPAGLYGNFGQANYSAAKLALVGFAETLAKEGFKYNIKANVIAPLAKSRMTETILPPDILEKLLPEKISPLVLYLTSENTPSTGSIYEVAAGFYAQIRWERSGGAYLKPDASLTPEAILNKWSDVMDFKDAQYPIQLNDYNKVIAKTSKLPSNDQGKIKLRSLKGKVVIITGAGSGLGRTHALLFAKYGAKVVVNDFKDPLPVVQEIKKLGGEAIGSTHDVYSQAEDIVKTAVSHYGTVDVLVNNAGILRDKSFLKMTDKEWEQVIQIHLYAVFRLCKLVWPIFLEKKEGSIINTTSTSGIYGNFGQANYGSAKAAVLGFTRTLAIEGKKHNIKVNAIAPHAETAMTRTIFNETELNKFSADQVSPLVVLLSSDELKVTGELFEVGAGWVGNTRWQRAKGSVSHDQHIKPEFVRESWKEITDFSKPVTVSSTQESSMAILDAVGDDDDEEEEEDEDEEEGDEDDKEDVKPADESYVYDHRQVILYNLGVGAHAKDLKYVYEYAEDFQPVPTFGVIPYMNQDDGGLNFVNLVKNFNPMLLLHGEHYLKINKFPIPTQGTLVTKSYPIAVLSKSGGKNALIISGSDTLDKESGESVFYNEGSYFVRGATSKSGKDEIFKERGSKFAGLPFNNYPKREPDYEVSIKTSEDQAALYRLCADFNPLHIDPNFAKGANFKKPILHGLCFFGISCKALFEKFGEFDEAKIRFTNIVYPGETLKVLAWKENNVVLFKTLAVERNTVVIDNAGLKLRKVGDSKM